MTTLITSQDFIDADVVAAKIKDGDFTVQVSPEFEINGETFRVILDGHHSFAAAIEAGVDSDIVEMSETDDDRVALINDPEAFLAACWMDGEYRNAKTGAAIW